MEEVRAAVVQQQPKGGDELRRNRRILQDIGNRPITRSFHAQLIAKAQEKGVNNANPVVLPVLDDKVALNQKRFPAKKVVPRKEIEKPKTEAVVVISSDEEEEKKEPVNLCKPEEVRKEVKTLTLILTARSKAMALGVNTKPKEKIVEIDSADVNDELAVVEYIDDLYKFYKLTEDDSRVHDYMESQPDINSKMRSILVDWLVEVHKKFELMPETFYLTVNILDRYLSMKIVSRRELQLVGISSMVVASKYEEIWAPQVNDFVCLSDYAYTANQILRMEKAILGKLEWYLTVPTPYVFLSRYIKASVSPDVEVNDFVCLSDYAYTANQILRMKKAILGKLGWYLTVPTPYVFLSRYIKASVSPDVKIKNMVFFLAELGILHYPTIILYSPSLIAAAAVYAARFTLDKVPVWTETLKHHTGYSAEHLRDCARLLVGLHSNAAGSKLQAVFRKFSMPEYGAVALFVPAKSFHSSS